MDIIEGKFTGNIEVTELLNARKTADITGVIVTGKIQIEAGAMIDVQSCRTGGKSKLNVANGQGKGRETLLTKEAS